MTKTTYKISKSEGYECLLEAAYYPDYVHVTFSTFIEVPNVLLEPRKQFEMFLEPEELQSLLTALTITQYDWHQHNKHTTES